MDRSGGGLDCRTVGFISTLDSARRGMLPRIASDGVTSACPYVSVDEISSMYILEKDGKDLSLAFHTKEKLLHYTK